MCFCADSKFYLCQCIYSTHNQTTTRVDLLTLHNRVVTQPEGHTELLEELVCHMHVFMYTIHFFPFSYSLKVDCMLNN